MMVYALSLVLLLAVVYYFKPSLFNFMKFTQGFTTQPCDPDAPDYEDCLESLNESFVDADGDGVEDEE